jgi:hypothetical protein
MSLSASTTQQISTCHLSKSRRHNQTRQPERAGPPLVSNSFFCHGERESNRVRGRGGGEVFLVSEGGL